ncbi:MAG: hypothetical protein H6813_01615 [Phycisphaeraceae bacterium]|nr:hypothetical protein [Phycisphaeraceae bacterium]
MKMHSLTALTLAAITGLGAVVIVPTLADDQSPRRRSAMMGDDAGDALQAEETKIAARRDRIKDELAALDREELDPDDWARAWAGGYYAGDGLGTNVSIHLAPKSGISFLNYGCLGLYGGDHGEIVGVEPDGLRLRLVFGSAHNSFLSERIYFVRWGEDRYLVPDWLMMEVVNNYNRGGWYREDMFGIPRLVPDGEHPRRYNAESGQREGKPRLPDEFMPMLLDEPLALGVTHVSDIDVTEAEEHRKCETCTVTFDRGTEAGIHAGMEFDFGSSRGRHVYGSYRITFADTGMSTAEFTVRSYAKAPSCLPSPGETVWTRDDGAPTPEDYGPSNVGD